MLAWAAKRWSHARLLKIDIHARQAKELSQALACSKTDDLACLEEVCHVVPPQCLVGGYIAPLCLRALSKYWAATCKLNVYADNDPACVAACSQLVTQARNVQVPVPSCYNMRFCRHTLVLMGTKLTVMHLLLRSYVPTLAA